MVNFQVVEQIEKILDQILQSGVHELDLLRQLYLFRAGMPFIELAEACTVENGTIQRLAPEREELYILHAQNAIREGRVMKFVPASGAATRMFKSLLAVLASDDDLSWALLKNRANKQSDYKFTLHFLQNIRSFAFFGSLSDSLRRDGYSIDDCLRDENFRLVLQYIVEECGLGYAQLPKGLIEFHAYEHGEVRTAFAEHLIEALDYTADRHGCARVHFTVSPEYIERVKVHLSVLQEEFRHHHYRLDIQLSEQKNSTNTIAVTPENEPFLTDDGLHFRPAGHGALLENLNDLAADIAILKNIDNVVPDRLKPITYRYKRVLCGLLVELQEQIFLYLREMEKREYSLPELLSVAQFAKERLCIDSLANKQYRITHEFQQMLFDILNRPLRVCGMVKNVGEPGGGPFVVRKSDTSTSLQIVESAQIDLSHPHQKAIFESSTHFNPVDIVCGLRNYKGEQFNLHNFRDDETGFISVKSSNGRELKALELPGLWNGSMAHWNTVFVEVPSATFHPVKTIRL
ncbi:MAG: DUF4301 family protein [Candidatus Kapaibacterium sp.]|nr:MAG: DUF4301 family protein [Candidatus Kapabacteria bacterium]